MPHSMNQPQSIVGVPPDKISRCDLFNLKQIEAALRADLRDVEQRLKIRLGSLIVVVVTVLFAALHYWPPHG